MTHTLSILAISGSLRRSSFNTGLLRAAAELAPADVALRIHDLNDVPLYNGDEEGEGEDLPQGVLRLQSAIKAADALLVATPEYNYSIPGVLKNALDWASRPPGRSALAGKPLAILGGGGGSGTMRAQFHLRQILVANNVFVLNKPEVYVPQVWERFDKEGTLVDKATRDQVQNLVAALAAWTRRLQAGA